MTTALAKRNTGVQVRKATQLATRLRKRQRRAMAKLNKIDRLLLADGSGSMATVDAHGLNGRTVSRWDALQQAWRQLRKRGAGRLGAYVFSGGVHPVRGSATGSPVDLVFRGGDTPMCAALRTVRDHAHRSLEALLISDGLPTDGDVLRVAQTLTTPINTVYVGPGGAGADTLQEIAEITGGEFLDLSRAAGGFFAGDLLEHATRILLERGDSLSAAGQSPANAVNVSAGGDGVKPTGQAGDENKEQEQWTQDSFARLKQQSSSAKC